MTATPERLDDSAETILQFGAGRFLRGFVDLFVEEARRTPAERSSDPDLVESRSVDSVRVGRVLVVQSTAGDRARRLEESGGRYHVCIRGVEAGRVVDRVEEVSSISRALVAAESWHEVLEAARSAALSTIVSNTTERGYEVDVDENVDPRSTAQHGPISFPARLLSVLWVRHEAGLGGFSIFPCELVEENARRLRDAVLGLARRCDLPTPFLQWARETCRWHCTLVDRIVTEAPREHPMRASDPLLIACEPFALFAIESPDGHAEIVKHPAIEIVPDVTPYALRKVRILNGAHTALVERCRPLGLETVREAIQDTGVRAWLEALLFEEIVPLLEGRTSDPAAFARRALERFENPFIEHRLEDIAIHHEEKLRTRLLPSLRELESEGRAAPRLGELLAPLVG